MQCFLPPISARRSSRWIDGCGMRLSASPWLPSQPRPGGSMFVPVRLAKTLRPFDPFAIASHSVGCVICQTATCAVAHPPELAVSPAGGGSLKRLVCPQLVMGAGGTRHSWMCYWAVRAGGVEAVLLFPALGSSVTSLGAFIASTELVSCVSSLAFVVSIQQLILCVRSVDGKLGKLGKVDGSILPTCVKLRPA